jgi:hypothetical protein
MSDLVEIIIRTIDESSGANGSIIGSFTEMQSAIGLAKEGFEILQGVYEQTVGKAEEYAESIKQISQISGQSSEDTSRMVSVMKTWGVTTESITTATRKMTSEGLTPNMQTIASLADKYNSFSTQQEKNEFVIKNLGRAGLDWEEALSKGSAALLAQADAVDQNLILNEQQLEDAERLKVANKQLADSWDGLSIAIGQVATPTMTKIFEVITGGIKGIEMFGDTIEIVRKKILDLPLTEKELAEQQTAVNLITGKSTEMLSQNAEAATRSGIAVSHMTTETKDAYGATSELTSKLLTAKSAIDGSTIAYKDMGNGLSSVSHHYVELTAAQNNAVASNTTLAQSSLGASGVTSTFSQALVTQKDNSTNAGNAVKQLTTSIFDFSGALSGLNTNNAIESFGNQNSDTLNTASQSWSDYADNVDNQTKRSTQSLSNWITSLQNMPGTITLSISTSGSGLGPQMPQNQQAPHSQNQQNFGPQTTIINNYYGSGSDGMEAGII